MEGSVPLWQAASLLGVVGWLLVSSKAGLTRKLRSLVQPWVTRRVQADTRLILRVQRLENGFMDVFFSVISVVVSVPFYTGFLPIVFWSGHTRLARQMTLLIAFCDYFGNATKDLVSAPRPSCPPVRRLTATTVEKEHAMEYGLPSSHALNTVCLAGYILHYVVSDNAEPDHTKMFIGFTIFSLVIFLIALARVYLGMHSVIDVVAGLILGLAFLAFWITIQEYVDDFVISGQNVISYWAALSFLLCFAYPAPELPTPTFDYHTAFNGVALGIVSGVHQTFSQFHHEGVARIFRDLSLPAFTGRVLVGIPTILMVKFCSKALSKWLLPMICGVLSLPVRSSSYIPSLREHGNGKCKSSNRLSSSGCMRKLMRFIPQESFDVDTGIRFFQYAGLAWSVVDLAPSIFTHFRL